MPKGASGCSLGSQIAICDDIHLDLAYSEAAPHSQASTNNGIAHPSAFKRSWYVCTVHTFPCMLWLLTHSIKPGREMALAGRERLLDHISCVVHAVANYRSSHFMPGDLCHHTLLVLESAQLHHTSRLLPHHCSMRVTLFRTPLRRKPAEGPVVVRPRLHTRAGTPHFVPSIRGLVCLVVESLSPTFCA